MENYILKKAYFLIFICFIFGFFSCSKHIYPSVNTKDSIIYLDKIVYKDTIIKTPQSIIKDTLLINYDSINKFVNIQKFKKNKQVNLFIENKGNNLIITASCDSLQQVITKYKEINQNLQNHTKSEKIVVAEKYIPKLYKISLFFSIFTLLFIIGYILIKLKIIKIV